MILLKPLTVLIEVEILAYYKFDPRIIDVVASLYTGDETEINVNGEVMGNMKVRNGIRHHRFPATFPDGD